MTMIRKQFFIDREASARLKRAATARGVSEAELIRQGIARVVGETESEADDWKNNLKAAVKAIPPGMFDDLAERVGENRRMRAERMQARHARNRTRLDGKE
jgi:hypothetical protein